MSLDLPKLKRIRRRIQRRRYNRGAVIGDGNGNVYAGIGQTWVRFRAGNDAYGTVTYGPPVKVNNGDANYWDKDNAPVRIVYDEYDELTIKGIDNREARSAGLDSRMLNYGSKISRWFLLKYATRGACRPVGNSTDTSTLVSVRKLLYDDNYGDIGYLPETGRQSSKIDLASYIPAAGYHRIVCVFGRIGADTYQVVGSTAQLESSDLDITDFQECFDQRDFETIPLGAFKLHNAQTTVDIRDYADDLRQFVNMPQREGFPNPVAKKTILRVGMSQTISGKLTITGKLTVTGKLTIADTEPCVPPYPIGPVYLTPDMLTDTGVATSIQVLTSCLNNGYFYQDSPADAQTVFSTRAWLSKGSYRVRSMYVTATTNGIFKIRLTGPETHTTAGIDGYGASSFNNITDNTVTLTQSGEYQIDGIVDGKNGSSTDYYTRIQTVSITRI
jgi:hypothetical protein